MTAFVFSGCAPDKDQEEVVDLNKEPASISTEVSAEKPKKNNDSLLKAPGNYIRNTVGQIDKAKKATAVYENSDLEHMDASESTGESAVESTGE